MPFSLSYDPLSCLCFYVSASMFLDTDNDETAFTRFLSILWSQPARAAPCVVVYRLLAGAAPPGNRPARSSSSFNSFGSIFSVHITGGSSGFTVECRAPPGMVPRSWSITGSTPR